MNREDLFPAPTDALKAIFTPEVLAKLKQARTRSASLRIDVLSACGPMPREVGKKLTIASGRAKRAAWETYLTAAFACGLFEGDHGLEIVARLTGADDKGFRSGLAECYASWFLAGVLKLAVRARPEGRPGRVPDLLVELPDGDIRVEVKAPHRERPSGRNSIWNGDDADILARCLEDASKQLDRGVRNVLLLAPRLRTPVYWMRDQLIRAFYGETKFTFLIDTTTGEAVTEPGPEFFPNGSLVKRWDNREKPFRFTRIGAVVSLEEQLIDRADGSVLCVPKALIAHNPYSPQQIPAAIWGSYPQLVKRGDGMEWTDRQE